MFEYTGNYSSFEYSAPPVWRSNKRCTKASRNASAFAKLYRPFPCQSHQSEAAQSRIKMLERMELIAPAHVDTRFVLASERRKACLIRY